MRSGGILFLLTILMLACSQSVFASTRTDQGTAIRTLESSVQDYHTNHGEYPVSDNQSTWYEKVLPIINKSYRRLWRVTPDGRFPLDFLGQPFIYEPPSSTNGNHVVVRTIGPNGVDDQGALDDWDSRFGPNPGYWTKKDWPAATRRAWICAILALAGVFYIVKKHRRTIARFVFASLWLGVLAGVVLPIGFDTGWGLNWGIGLAGYDPAWITPVSIAGVLLLIYSIPLLTIYFIYLAWYRRSLRREGTLLCAQCKYDLRGTIAANIDRCPECGELVPKDSDKDIDLNPPPSP